MYRHHIQQILSSNPSGFGPQFWGAFFGAFFAFIFGLAAYRITKRWERFVQHKNALVKLERTLNRHYNALTILENLANDTSAILQQGKMTSNRFFNLNIPAELDLELASLSLINKLFTYEFYIERYNINVLTFNSALMRFEDLLIAGQPLQRANLDFTTKMLDGFKKELPTLAEETKSLLILVNIHLKKINEKGNFLYGVINSKFDFEISQNEIAQETSKFDDGAKKSPKG